VYILYVFVLCPTFLHGRLIVRDGIRRKIWNICLLQAARDEYDKVEEIWIKKFQETVTYARKVHAALKAFVDHRHEEARKKAFGKHQFLYSGQEKANAMLVEGKKSQKFR